MDNYQNMMTKNKIVQTAGEEYLGTVIHIPANVKQWHGAAADSWFAHLTFNAPARTSRTNGWNLLATRTTAGWQQKNKSAS